MIGVPAADDGFAGIGSLRVTQGAPTFGQVNSGTPSLAHFAPGIPWARPDSVPAAPTPITNVTMAEARFPGAGAIAGRLGADMATPTLDTAVSELNDIPSNWFISIPRSLISYSDTSFQMPFDGQLVLAVRDQNKSIAALSGHPASTARRIHASLTLRAGTSAGAGRIGVFNVAQFNWLSASSERKVGPYEHVKTAEEHWSNWNIEGVVRYEEGKYNRWGRVEDPRAEKTVTSTKRGLAFMHNNWSNDLQAGTLLYLLLVRQARSALPHTIGLDAKGTGRKATTPAAGLTDHPFQLHFWANRTQGRPTSKDLEYVDDYGRKHWGKALYVGRVDNPDRMSHEGFLKKSAIDTASSVSTGKLWVFLDSDE